MKMAQSKSGEFSHAYVNVYRIIFSDLDNRDRKLLQDSPLPMGFESLSSSDAPTPSEKLPGTLQ